MTGSMSTLIERARRFTAMGLGVVLLTCLGLTGNGAERPSQDPATSASTGEWQVKRGWPSMPAGIAWGEVPGVAVDHQDQVWVFNRGALPVQAFSTEGNYLRGWGERVIAKAHGIRFDHEGNLWLTDIGRHVVRKFTPQGKELMVLGTPDRSGEDPTHFNQPTDVAIDPVHGDIFVADGYGNNRVVVFDRTGRYLRAFGKKGEAPGEFQLPHAIALDSKGRVYVADRSNARIQVFDRDGAFLSQWTNTIVPWGIWITPKDEVFVCGGGVFPPRQKLFARLVTAVGAPAGVPPREQWVVQFQTDGQVRRRWSFPETADGHDHQPGELSWVHGITIDSRGNLYLGEIQGRRAQKFSLGSSEEPRQR